MAGLVMQAPGILVAVEVVRGSNFGQTQSHQAWNQTDWHSIASQLGSLDLQPALTCPSDGAWGLVEDQSGAGGVANWDPIKGTSPPYPTAVSVQESVQASTFYRIV